MALQDATVSLFGKTLLYKIVPLKTKNGRNVDKYGTIISAGNL